METSRLGAPLPYGVSTPADVVVHEVGDYDEDDGVRIVLTSTSVVFKSSVDGTHIILGFPITKLLEAIQEQTHKQES